MGTKRDISKKMLDYSKLRIYVPIAVYEELLDVCTKFNINNPLRLSHFLAQCAHESNEFKVTQENLNYSAKRLLQVFPKYFDEQSALEYERNPVSIASRVYADRMGNGPEDSQEGWEYRGRGYIQLTGKDNYRSFGQIVPEDIINNPDLVATKYPLLSAAWFWHSRKLNEIADQGDNENVIATITKKVNGGMNGIAERTEYFNRYYKVLNA